MGAAFHGTAVPVFLSGSCTVPGAYRYGIAACPIAPNGGIGMLVLVGAGSLTPSTSIGVFSASCYSSSNYRCGSILTVLLAVKLTAVLTAILAVIVPVIVADILTVILAVILTEI